MKRNIRQKLCWWRAAPHYRLVGLVDGVEVVTGDRYVLAKGFYQRLVGLLGYDSTVLHLEESANTGRVHEKSANTGRVHEKSANTGRVHEKSANTGRVHEKSANTRSAHEHPKASGCTGIAITGCRSVHTHGMAVTLDIAFIDSRGQVHAIFYGVPPGIKIAVKDAQHVLERVVLPNQHQWKLQVGQKVALQPVASVAAKINQGGFVQSGGR